MQSVKLTKAARNEIKLKSIMMDLLVFNLKNNNKNNDKKEEPSNKQNPTLKEQKPS
ncbi:MAG: hypothetical protein IPM95_11900 [Sphingobacteriales bacterium]|nr:hypothetical protein [Sphingobacteriales bacterium]